MLHTQNAPLWLLLGDLIALLSFGAYIKASN